VVASFAIRRQGVISVGVVPCRSSSLSGMGIVVHGWGIIVRVGARSVLCFAQPSFVGAGSSFVCGAHHSWVCHGWWLSLVGFRVLFVVCGCQGRCVNGCWGWCVGVVVRRWGVSWKVASTWHAWVPCQRFGGGAVGWAPPPFSIVACVLSCPHHRVIVIVIIPLMGHMVVPSSSCVSARWVGTNVGWGYSPWRPKIHNNDERQMSVVIRRLVATSLTATWHLDAVLEGSVVGASELLTLLVVVWFWSCVLAVVCEPRWSVLLFTALDVV